MAPIVVGLAPFGMTIGATAATRELGPLATAATTLGVYSGSAQLVAVELLAEGAAPLVLLAVVGVVNARMALFSAGVRATWAGARGVSRAVAGYLLVDPVFLLSRDRQAVDPDPGARRRHYLGAALTLWVGWLAANTAGFVVGGSLPVTGPVVLATPLVLLAMAAGSVSGRPALAAAVTSGTVVVVLHGLPHDLGFVTAGLAGIAAGLAVEDRAPRPRAPLALPSAHHAPDDDAGQVAA